MLDYLKKGGIFMKNIIFLIFITSNFLLSDNCEKKAIIATYHCSVFEYEKCFKILNENYQNCKNDCHFIHTYNRFFSVSSDENFKKISYEDILKQEECKLNFLPFGPIYFYLRNGKNNEVLSKYEEGKIRETVDDFIFYNNFKKGDLCKLVSEAYKEKPEAFFAKEGAAYLFFKCGDEERAKEIASPRFKHFYEKKKCLLCKANDGLPNVVVENLIYSLIFNIELKKDEIEKLNKAKEYFPYIFKLNGFQDAQNR